MKGSAKAAWGMAALAALYLPFLHQAFHIDDTFFLAVADHLLADWRHPFAFLINWRGTAEPAFDIVLNPPLHSYFLAGVLAVWGHAEWAVHAASFGFVLLAFGGMAWLGRRFGVSPPAAALLVLGTPAALVMSHTAMPDMALLAYLVAAVACFIAGIDQGRWRWLIAAGLLAGAAALTKYSGLSVLPICALYVALVGPRDRRRVTMGVVACLIPVALMGTWSLINLLQDGRLHLAVSSAYLQQGSLRGLSPAANVGLRALALLHAVGGTTVFPASLLLLAVMGRRGRAWWGGVGLWLGCVVLARGLCRYTLLQTGLAALMLAAGVTVVSHLIWRPAWRGGRRWPLNRRAAEELFLIGWMLLIAIPLVQAYFPAVRRLLPLLPPLVLLFLRELAAAESAWCRRWQPQLVRATVLLTLLLGLGVAWADTQQADLYRRVATQLAREARSPHGTTWSAGHWGFQYYLERLGIRPWDRRRDALHPGDRLLVAVQPWPQVQVGPIDQLARLPSGTTIQTAAGPLTVIVPRPPAWPLRTVCWLARAHFYSYLHPPNILAMLPYSISRAPLELFLVYQVPEPAPVPPGLSKREDRPRPVDGPAR